MLNFRPKRPRRAVMLEMVVMGRQAKRVAAADAMEYVFGYTLLHDVSARDIQFDWSKRTQDTQIILGKNPDTFSPIGPEIVTTDELTALIKQLAEKKGNEE